MFEHRTWLPVPFALTLMAISVFRPPAGRTALSVTGAMLLLAGETIRLWAVRYIGVISRTRTDRLGPLVTTGPFAVLRNPLYLGNLLIWSGLAFWAGAPRMMMVVWLLFGLLYFFIVRWEVRLLEARHGETYGGYARRVRAWLPRVPPAAELLAAAPFGWRDALFSERGTLIAIVAMALLLSI